MNHRRTSSLVLLRQMWTRVGFPLVILIDLGLVVTALLMFATDATVLFFHIIFLLLAMGAFYWSFRAFAWRALLWVCITTTEVSLAVLTGQTQSEELIEIPLLSAILVYIVFISDRRAKAEAQRLRLVREAEQIRILTQFIHDVSHHFRTPLSVIQGNIYMLGKTVDCDQQQKRLETIMEQTGLMEKLVDNLLILTQLNQGATFGVQPIQLKPFLEEILAKMQPLAKSKQLVLTVVAEADLPLVYGDRNELQRAVMNLIENALQHTPEGGSISVQANATRGQMRISITDNGRGIEMADLPHIFEPMYRGDKAGSTIGLGLGLSIAQKIVEIHQGKIEVESTKGNGATFHIMLPLMRTEAA